MSSFQGHTHSLFLPYTKTNQIYCLNNQELDPKLAYNMELANSALHVSCLVGKKKKHFEYLVAETETRTGTGTRSRASLLLELEYLDHRCLILEKLELELELEPQHRASLFLEP